MVVEINRHWRKNFLVPSYMEHLLLVTERKQGANATCKDSHEEILAPD
jgi:hypothetical protein